MSDGTLSRRPVAAGITTDSDDADRDENTWDEAAWDVADWDGQDWIEETNDGSADDWSVHVGLDLAGGCGLIRFGGAIQVITENHVGRANQVSNKETSSFWLSYRLPYGLRCQIVRKVLSSLLEPKLARNSCDASLMVVLRSTR